jgi:anhydro-N-acetylmuramic acid kinase
MIDRSELTSQFLAHCLPAMIAKSHLVLGIMSGTSIDGVDYALCEIGEERVRLRELWSAEFPHALRRRLHDAARNAANGWEVAQLHHDLGRFYAAKAVRRGARWKPQWVGLHGQTIFHNPAGPAPATLQLGEPAYLAESLHSPVVSNFRVADLAAGGQGAPLATMFHLLVFGERGCHVCVNNLGGISNVTSIDWCRGREPRVLAFDTGPANVLVDLAMRHFTRGRASFDVDGAWAAKGSVCEPLLRDWLQHPFFRAKPPKSTGRELFGESFFEAALREIRKARLSKFDAVATFTALTAKSLALNYRRHLPAAPSRVILTGGGAANPTLRRMIAEALRELNHGTTVQASDELGWPVQSIEPAAFALLAWLRMKGRTGNLPQTTGATRAMLLGQVTEPTPAKLSAGG